MPERARAAAIVLAGGGSKRMGTPKAALEWHGSTLLRRAVGIVGRCVDGPVVVVRAAGQALPAVPVDVEIVDDAREDRGPVQGIASGFAHLGARAAIVYVTAIDAPLLHPAFVRQVLRSLRSSDDVALPNLAGVGQPLAAAYRTAIAPLLEAQLALDLRDTRSLFARPDVRVRALDEHALLADPDLAALDPRLHSLLNLNEPGEYEAARRRPAPGITVLSPSHAGPHTIHAATLAAAAAAAGVALTRDLVATLTEPDVAAHVALTPDRRAPPMPTSASAHGTPSPDHVATHGDGRAISDPSEPLVAGDVVTFERAPTTPAAQSQQPPPW